MLMLLAFASCDDLEDREINYPDNGKGDLNETGTAELYVLNEGLINLNNSTLARHSFKDNRTVSDYFGTLNHRGLGDTANDMAIYGNKLYIVVHISSTIEVVDLSTGVVVKQIPMVSESQRPTWPRSIAFKKNKAYVCSYDGTVARIDTTSLHIEAYATAGRNPEDLCVQDDALYVSNSGGMDASGAGVDRTVSVIDLNTFRETKKIEVGPNPGQIEAGPEGSNTVFVVTHGEQITNGDYKLVKIDTRTCTVAETYDEKVMSFAINDRVGYLYNYDFATKSSSIKVIDILTGKTIRENFITDDTVIDTPYCIHVNPFSGNVYISDAFNYQVLGNLYCFTPQGKCMFRLSGIGLNPNTVAFSERFSQSEVDDPAPEDPDAPSAFANTVWEYVPAPSQFMNTSTTAYKKGFTEKEVLEEASRMLKNPTTCLLSLGAYGGYITVGFDHAISNVPGKYDFKIYGNAYYDMYGTQTEKLGGSSEPGIVLVSKDTNGNGLPDDEWYELAGSEYNSPNTIKEYEITYYRPTPLNGDVKWKDNQGQEGVVKRITSSQESYYPAWMPDEISFRGSRLADNAVNEPRPGMPEHWVGYAYAYGYADNHPNNTEYCQFNIDWAVDKNGNPVQLDAIDFVRIYTAVNQQCGWMGEASTELQAVEDLHFKQ